MSKRGASPPPSTEGTLVKRARSNSPSRNQIAISSSNDERQKALIRSVKRTSNLEAPIISLSGAHSVRFMNLFLSEGVLIWPQAEILSCRFDPTGQNIAACSADRSVCMCHLYLSYVKCLRGKHSSVENLSTKYQLRSPL